MIKVVSKRIFTLLLLILEILVLMIGCEKDDPYPKYGRDTHDHFGNGRYLILSGRNAKSDIIDWCLYDCGEVGTVLGTVLDNHVAAYKDIPPYAYVIGESGYTKINYEKGEVEQSENISDYSEEDQKRFQKLEKRKSWFDFQKSDTYGDLVFALIIMIITYPLWMTILILSIYFTIKRIKKRRIKANDK